MSAIGAAVCTAISRLAPELSTAGTESAEAYSEAEYTTSTLKVDLYSKYVDLVGKKVLDAGCGLGGRSVYYAEQGASSVVGIDLGQKHIEDSIAFARQKGTPNVEFHVQDLQRLSFESNSFDVIFMNDVVEHIVRPKLVTALRECKRVLKPDGRLCLEFPPWSAPYASHLYKYINIPWCHLIFSDDALVTTIHRMRPRLKSKESVLRCFSELNRITAREFESLIEELEFKVIHFEWLMVKKVKWFRRLPPFLSRYLISRVVAVLSK